MSEHETPQSGETPRLDGPPPPTQQNGSAQAEESSGPKLVYSDQAQTPPTVEEINPPRGEPLPPVTKPDDDDGEIDLSRFEAKTTANIAGVKTMVTALPVLRPGDVKDFFRLHPGDEWWGPKPFCFFTVPIQGVKNPVLHLIDEEVAKANLDASDFFRRKLILGSKPNDVFFLCSVPCENLDNSWNETANDGCEQAKTTWVKVISEKASGNERYKIDYTEEPDAFPDSDWPKQSRSKLINATFKGKMVLTNNHPALARKIGRKVPIK
jgi:hypothetical protein